MRESCGRTNSGAATAFRESTHRASRNRKNEKRGTQLSLVARAGWRNQRKGYILSSMSVTECSTGNSTPVSLGVPRKAPGLGYILTMLDLLYSYF